MRRSAAAVGASTAAASGLCLLVFLVTVEAPGAAQVGPVIPCETCHDQVEGWGAMKSVHAPVEAAECTSCHNPHASKHASLVRREGEKICLGCHEDLASTLRPGESHGAVFSERACLSCHDPHASSRATLLRGEMVDLCRACHEDTLQAATGSHTHAPVEAGECQSCHEPHASTLTHLARGKEPELCTGCHSVADAQLKAKHAQLPLAGARCSSCHAPHGSDQPGMIRDTVHPPFAEGGCDNCHSNGAAWSAAEVTDLCLTCHEPRSSGHPVPEETACVACHTPHASTGPGLVKGFEEEVCLACHEQISEQRAGAVSYHPSFGMAQDCTVCHELHTGSTSALLKKRDAQRTCATCHSTHSEFSHPMGEGVADPSRPGRFVSCLSCHDPHGTSQQAFLLASPRQELCLRCHQTNR